MRWLAIVALLCAGCRTGNPPRIGERPARLSDEAERAYAAILDRYTDQGEIYDKFDTRLFAGATHQAWPFREARVNRMAEFLMLPPEEKAKRLAAERAEFEAAHELMLGVHVTQHQFDDFDRPNSIWRMVLVTQTGEFAPTRVERKGRADLAVRAIYPYLDDFWTAYRVYFPRVTPTGAPVIPPGQNEVILRLASTLGRVDLNFAAE